MRDIPIHQPLMNQKNATKNTKKFVSLQTLLDNDQTGGLVFNNLDLENRYKLIDLYFKQKNIMYTHLYNSFDKYLDEDIQTILKNGSNIFFEKITRDKIYRYKFVYNDVAIKPPLLDTEDDIMFPSQSRTRNLTYSAKLVATITQVQDTVDIATDKITSRVIGQPEFEYPIANIPIMVRSKYCSLNLKKIYDKSEDEYDPGGYFIVNGSEKCVMALERMVDNKPLVFIKKDSSSSIHTVQVNSRNYNTDQIQIVTLRIRKDNMLTIRVPILSEVPVFIVMRALGIESDKDLINYIVYDKDDIDMINLIRISLENSKPENGIKISTQEEAINYLINRLRVVRKYNETDKDIKIQEKKMHLKSLLRDSFLPHVEGDIMNKAYYLGYMINRLLQVYLGRIPVDDRDSFVNKRIDLPGTLLFELFKQFYKKMLNECSKFFRKRNQDDENPINIINQIKPNIIEGGLKTALLTGAWGKRKGVAQMLQRLTYLQTLSSLRRINSPTVDASTNKLTSPRHLHGTSIGFCCLTWDTEVLLSDGVTVKRIGEMTNSDTVTTINRKDLTTEPSRIKNYFSIMPDKLLKITTISGRKIKCTLDHPLLVKIKNGEYKMIEAGKLKEGDLVIIKHTQKYISDNKKTSFMIKSEDVIDKYRDKMNKLNLLDREFEQNELEIMARLVGANITDGHLSLTNKSKYHCEFFVGEIDDVNNLLEDIGKLGFEKPTYQERVTNFRDKKQNKIVKYHTFRISKGGIFGYLMFLLGSFIGKKTTKLKILPEWIKTANDRIIREFLNAFVGGDGAKINVAKTKRKKNNLTTYETCMHTLHQTTIHKYLEETIDYMKSIGKLFNKFGINNKITKNILSNGNYEVHIAFDNDLNNLDRFADYIGFRYCHEKQRNSALPIEYIKCKKFYLDNKYKLYEKVIELSKNNKSKLEIVNITGLSYEHVYSLIKKNNDGKIIGKRKSDKYKDYKLFKNNYFIKDNMISIPIAKIEEIQPEPVYDFTTVSDNHSFIANSVASSNCFIETPEGFSEMASKDVNMS